MKRHTGILLVVGVAGAAVIGLAVASLATGGWKCPAGRICPLARKWAPAKPSQPAANPTPAWANVTCPMMGSPIDPKNVSPELVRVFEGKRVAFCCGGCPTAWDKLSEAQKRAKLREASGEKQTR